MAAFGFWAILRERGGVEQDARREILQSIPADFGKSVATQIHGYKMLAAFWPQYQRVLARWPESQLRQQWLSDKNNIALTNYFAAWAGTFLDSRESILPLELSLNANGEFANVGAFYDFDIYRPPEPPGMVCFSDPGTAVRFGPRFRGPTANRRVPRVSPGSFRIFCKPIRPPLHAPTRNSSGSALNREQSRQTKQLIR